MNHIQIRTDYPVKHKEELISPLTPIRVTKSTIPFHQKEENPKQSKSTKSLVESPREIEKEEKNMISEYIKMGGEWNANSAIETQNIQIHIPEGRSKEECSLTYTTSIGSRKKQQIDPRFEKSSYSFDIREKVSSLKKYLERREKENNVSNVVYLKDLNSKSLFESLKVKQS